MVCRCCCRRQVKLQEGRQCRLQKGAALTALGNPLLSPSDTATYVLDLKAASWTTRSRFTKSRLGPPGHVLDHKAASWTTKLRSGPQGCVLDHQATSWTTRPRFGPPGHVLDHQATNPRFGPPGHVLDPTAAFWITKLRSGPPRHVLDDQAGHCAVRKANIETSAEIAQTEKQTASQLAVIH